MTSKEEKQQKKEEKRLAEEKRVGAMRRFEQEVVLEKFGKAQFPKLSSENALIRGSCLICGIDEAGRGPLAGPVAAGVCILPCDHDLLWVNDSKKISEKKREKLYEEIVNEALDWNVAMVSPARIDEINILQATYEAMRKALEGLTVKPEVLVNDAVIIPGVTIPQVGIIQGDAKCLSVAAASILAKVTRDRYMREEALKYPEYGFEQNKGYGTRKHIEAIQKYGPCPIHRSTFITHFI